MLLSAAVAVPFATGCGVSTTTGWATATGISACGVETEGETLFPEM